MADVVLSITSKRKIMWDQEELALDVKTPEEKPAQPKPPTFEAHIDACREGYEIDGTQGVEEYAEICGQELPRHYCDACQHEVPALFDKDGDLRCMVCEGTIVADTEQMAEGLAETPINYEKVAKATKTKPKSGPTKAKNGHKAAKTRRLNDAERTAIRQAFVNLNGIIEEDACKKMLSMMNTGATIFQITGFVTSLHKKVWKGEIAIADLPKYEAHLKTKHKMWAQYKSGKYQDLYASKVQKKEIHPNFTTLTKKTPKGIKKVTGSK